MSPPRHSPCWPIRIHFVIFPPLPSPLIDPPYLPEQIEAHPRFCCFPWSSKSLGLSDVEQSRFCLNYPCCWKTGLNYYYETIEGPALFVDGIFYCLRTRCSFVVYNMKIRGTGQLTNQPTNQPTNNQPKQPTNQPNQPNSTKQRKTTRKKKKMDRWMDRQKELLD